VIDVAKRKSAETGRTIGIIPETKHPSYFKAAGLPLEQRLVDVLNANGYTDKTPSPVIIQSFEVGNLKELRGLTKVRLVQLTDLASISLDGKINYNQPADFVLSGDKRTYGDLLTPEGLAEVATYADAIGPSKRSIVSVAGVDTDGDGKPDDLDGDGQINDGDKHLLPLPVWSRMRTRRGRWLLPIPLETSHISRRTTRAIRSPNIASSSSWEWTRYSAILPTLQ
jgi:glycerophosphoryl diester phosphodiesterase